VLGINGLTAFFGMEIAAPKKGDTLVVSADAGATGIIVGQSGEIHGCRVVGIAGSNDKCAWITKELGSTPPSTTSIRTRRKKLTAATPNGIDIDFRNVGGDIMQQVLKPHESPRPRRPLGPDFRLHQGRSRPRQFRHRPGQAPPRPGLHHPGLRFMEAATQLGQWRIFGKAKDRETIMEGPEKARCINMPSLATTPEN